MSRRPSRTRGRTFVIEGGQPLSRPHPRRREQERRAADPRRVPARGRAGHALRTCRASATSRRCSSSSRDIGARAEWTGPNEVRVHARGRRRRTSSTRSSASRMRASFLLAGPLLARLGPRERAASGRRRDRPPPARPAHPRASSELGATIEIEQPLRDASGRGSRARTSSSTRRA